MQTVVIADYANEAEYHAIKDFHGDPFPTLEQHREGLAAAERDLRRQGFEVVLEVCDLAGYLAFCERNKALNTPATVAAYVKLKQSGHEKEPHPEVQHQYIEVNKDKHADR